HYDQVTTVPLRRCDDRLIRLFTSLGDRVALDACELGLALQWCEQLLRVGLREHLQFRGWRFEQLLDDAGVIEFRHRMEARHSGTDLLCECNAPFDCIA